MDSRYSAFAVVSAAALALCAVTGPAWAKTDLAACYGETLDVAFRGWSNGGYDGTRILLRLPFPNSWEGVTVDATVRKGGGPQNLLDYPCLPEPIDVVVVEGGPFLETSPQYKNLLTGNDSIRLQSLTLTAADFEFVSESLDRNISGTLKDGSELPGGFVRAKGSNMDATGGRWLLPESYKAPDGRRIQVSCAWNCTVEYLLAVSQGADRTSKTWMYLSYRFDTGVLKYGPGDIRDFLPERWIAQDRIVRELINSWIVEEN